MVKKDFEPKNKQWWKSLLVGGVFGLILGIGAMKLKDSGIRLPDSYRVLSGYMILLIFICTYILAIAVHEIGHFVSFIKNGVQMRALYIMVFLFIKEEGRWRFKIRPNALTLIGGIAIPDVPAVDSEAELVRLQNAYASAILSGPLSTLYFLVASLAASVPILMTISNRYAFGIMITYDISLSIITVFLLMSCFIKNEAAIGDFPAYKMSKDDRDFVAIQLYQYMAFSTDPLQRRMQSGYLREVLLGYLSKEFETQSTKLFTLSILDYFLVLRLSGYEAVMDNVVVNYLQYFSNNIENLEIKNNEISSVLIFHLIGYLSLEEGKRNKAIELLELQKGRIKRQTRIVKYYIKQAEHLLGLSDNSNFLSQKDNIRTSSVWSLWSLFPFYYDSEERINRLEKLHE